MVDKEQLSEEYRYGFHDEDTSILKTAKGISEKIVRQISRLKGEPQWMEEFRVKAYQTFAKLAMPKFGPDLSFIDFQTYTYYTRPSEREETSWDKVPEKIKDTFQKLGIPEAEAKYLSGVTTQYESEVV
jgi:Fe-S cluster assembly protein SufB